ncbi:Las1-domain-containing protein [Decorospora gaudefroyi]|uniref:Las1-domain-containing protein n=1 Tax=Decorospora gaudefroyi TaxID=184978 RepID=A0A6A5K3N4_9PLEO|nr:Las1-domain-containing protein [Decorospora gaudefroyi]
MDSPTQFTVTPWRNSQELLQLRQDLYSASASDRSKAVNKLFAWRLRKPQDGLPLLLDSTADIVHVVLSDERGGLGHNSLRLLYATAVSRTNYRFITGLSDTLTDLSRAHPWWSQPGKTFEIPLFLLETRHRIVHRHLPSLAELKRAAKLALEWLWEWYWRQLDYAFNPGADGEGQMGEEAVKERLQGILKTYVKERKSEIKRREMESTRAADMAVSTYSLHFTSSTQTRRLLLQLLVDERMILPADKKLGSSMSGAFMVWMPLLHVLSASILPIPVLLSHMLSRMKGGESDPVSDALHAWICHLVSPTSTFPAKSKTVNQVLEQCFLEPTFWSLELAEKVLEGGEMGDEEAWRAVLDAAREIGGEEMEVEGVEGAGEVRRIEVQKEGRERIQGPIKVVGLWKARPIGWLPEGWEDDE